MAIRKDQQKEVLNKQGLINNKRKTKSTCRKNFKKMSVNDIQYNDIK